MTFSRALAVLVTGGVLLLLSGVSATGRDRPLRLPAEEDPVLPDDPQEARASYRIGFVQGEYGVRPEYMDNRLQIDRMKFNLAEALCTPGFALDSVVVVANASPEGVWETNAALSGRRGESVVDLIREYMALNGSYPDVRFSVRNVPENWEQLDRLIDADPVLTDAQKEQYRSRRAIMDPDTRELAMRGDSYYGYMSRELYPALRTVDLAFRGHGLRSPYLGVQHDTVLVFRHDTLYYSGTGFSRYSADALNLALLGTEMDAEPEPEPEKPIILAMRTNFLAVPLANFGLEFPIGNSWSVSTDVYYPWIWRDKVHKDCFEFWAMDADVRYWFRGVKDPNPYHRLRGHSVGAYVAAGYYDFQKDWSGHQGEYINVGVDYMYSAPIFKGKMRLQFELGIGYIYSPARVYDCFEEGGKLFKRRGTMQYTRWFGPTRAQVSFVIPIYGKDRKKGGEL